MPAQRRPPPTSLRELEIRALALQGHSLAELARALDTDLPVEPRRAKGFVGMLAERSLGADAKAGEAPDFPHLAVELKTVPVDSAGGPVESTFCCSIDMRHAAEERWETSRLRRRLTAVLWLPVEAVSVAPLGERRFGQARLWRPTPGELALLASDWEDLMGAVGAGRPPTAHHGRVLQIRPKAANSRVRRLGPSDDGVARVLPLGFYLRRGAVAQLLVGQSFAATASARTAPAQRGEA